MYGNTAAPKPASVAVELAHQVDVADDLGAQRLDDLDDRLEVAHVQRLGPAEIAGDRRGDLGLVVDPAPVDVVHAAHDVLEAGCCGCARMRSAQPSGGSRSVSKPTRIWIRSSYCARSSFARRA